MTINRRWIAREWLYLLGFLWAFLSPILIRLLARAVSWIFPRLYPPAFSLGLVLLIVFGPYVIFQLVRMTWWAIRTLREPE